MAGVISIEKSVPETLLFGAPFFQFGLCMCPYFLPLAPCNASYEGGVVICCTLKVEGVAMNTRGK